MRKIAVPFAVGLALAPAGGVAGAAVIAATFFASTLPAAPSPLFIRDMLALVLFGGPIFGSILALPIAACVLPSAYLLLRGSGKPMRKALVLCGLCSGGILMLGIFTYSLLASVGDPFFHLRVQKHIAILLLTAGAFGGAVVAWLFALIMRGLDPDSRASEPDVVAA